MVERYDKPVWFRFRTWLCKVMFNRHVVSLIPIGVPSATKRKPWSKVEVYFSGWPKSVRWWNVANVVADPKTFYVVRIFSGEVFQTTLPFMLNVEVNATPLATYTGSCVLNFEVLLKSNITPVRDLYRSNSFCEDNLWIGMLKRYDKEFKRELFNIFVWS